MKRKIEREKLFYILAFVPEGAPNRFFVLTQDEANALIASELMRLGRPEDYRVTGFIWSLALPHEDAWQKLPS